LNKFKSDKKEKILSIFNSLNIKKNLDSINSNSKNKRAAHNLNDILWKKMKDIEKLYIEIENKTTSIIRTINKNFLLFYDNIILLIMCIYYIE